MSRSGRYSKKQIKNSSFESEKSNLLPQIEHDYQLYLNDKLHPAVVIGNYLICVSQFRKKNFWLGAHYHWFSPLIGDDFINFWSKNLLRSIPWKVNYVLINWYLGYFPLELVDYIPTAPMMLSLQAKGKRYITLFRNSNFWNGDILHQRDHFSFTVHDLIHAYEFFYHEQIKNQQVEFYKMLNKHYPILSSIKKEKFQQDLDYLISDMNSHPKHLLAYWEWLLADNNIVIPI